MTVLMRLFDVEGVKKVSDFAMGMYNNAVGIYGRIIHEQKMQRAAIAGIITRWRAGLQRGYDEAGRADLFVVPEGVLLGELRDCLDKRKKYEEESGHIDWNIRPNSELGFFPLRMQVAKIQDHRACFAMQDLWLRIQSPRTGLVAKEIMKDVVRVCNSRVAKGIFMISAIFATHRAAVLFTTSRFFQDIPSATEGVSVEDICYPLVATAQAYQAVPRIMGIYFALDSALWGLAFERIQDRENREFAIKAFSCLIPQIATIFIMEHALLSYGLWHGAAAVASGYLLKKSFQWISTTLTAERAPSVVSLQFCSEPLETLRGEEIAIQEEIQRKEKSISDLQCVRAQADAIVHRDFHNDIYGKMDQIAALRHQHAVTIIKDTWHAIRRRREEVSALCGRTLFAIRACCNSRVGQVAITVSGAALVLATIPFFTPSVCVLPDDPAQNGLDALAFIPAFTSLLLTNRVLHHCVTDKYIPRLLTVVANRCFSASRNQERREVVYDNRAWAHRVSGQLSTAAAISLATLPFFLYGPGLGAIVFSAGLVSTVFFSKAITKLVPNLGEDFI